MTNPYVYPADQTILGNPIYRLHVFRRNKHTVPIVNVTSQSALSQIIGYMKVMNRNVGNVYYRGQNHLYDNMIPSLYRTKKDQPMKQGGFENREKKLDQYINTLISNEAISKQFVIDAKNNGIKPDKIVLEATLQHYGLATRCIDCVDNHWVALWFGLYQYIHIPTGMSYCTYNKRLFNPSTFHCCNTEEDDENYQYLILLCDSTPSNKDESDKDTENRDSVNNRGRDVETIQTIDMRSYLPSIFIRPHAQHAVMLRRNKAGDQIDRYDLSDRVVVILRIRVDRVDEWLGNGTLLSQSTLFPSPAYDQGYRNLLEYQSMLDGLNIMKTNKCNNDESKMLRISNYVE